MKPSSPVSLVHPELPETVYAKNQPPYIPLPTVLCDGPEGMVISRWKLSLCERLKVLFFGNIWLRLLTFGKPLQPIALEVDDPWAVRAGKEK